MRRAAIAVLLGLASLACRTAPVAWTPLAAGDPRPAARTAALAALAEARHTLRATGRVTSDAGFARELLLVARPASLRVEVLGAVLNQRVLVLATDGKRYELYRAESRGLETGEVHPAVLEEVAGLPLTPEAAVSLLLAAPRPPEGAPASAREDAAGGLSLRWPEQTLDFDAAGRLVALAFHPGGRDVLRARWSEWDDSSQGPFPHRLELELFEPPAHWKVDYRDVWLNPVLAPELFRLEPTGG